MIKFLEKYNLSKIKKLENMNRAILRKLPHNLKSIKKLPGLDDFYQSLLSFKERNAINLTKMLREQKREKQFYYFYVTSITLVPNFIKTL